MTALRHGYHLLFALIFLVSLSACDSGEKKRVFHQPAPQTVVPGVETPDDPYWAEYVARHTSGSVSRNSHIEVNFVRDIVSEARIGTDASAAIELSPAVDAEIVYEGLR
ncbi:MAG: hypothetical protein OEZ23_08305, partial [Gammaproteobacteria bacterium]|nr:hypothetical protein [Gammaproteobacteria bacterium]